MSFLRSTRSTFIIVSTIFIIFFIFSSSWFAEKMLTYKKQLAPVKIDPKPQPEQNFHQEHQISQPVDQKPGGPSQNSLSKIDSAIPSSKLEQNDEEKLKEHPALFVNSSSKLESSKASDDAGDNPSRDLEWKLMNILAEERLAGLQRGCHVNNKPFGLHLGRLLDMKSNRPRFYFSDKYKLLLCEVPKCGSTSWKKALLTMEDMDIAKEKEHIGGAEAHAHGAFLNFWKAFNESDPKSVAKAKERITNYTRVMTVREPLQRLVSAYKDKMLPTGSGGESFGAMSRRIHEFYKSDKNATGGIDGNEKIQSYATWEEFVRYLVDENRKIYIDAHWQLFSEMCYPCDVAYHYVAKLETIYHDISYLSKVIGYDMTPFFPASKERGRHEKWSTEYQKYYTRLSTEDREKLYKMYMEQYDLFGYSRPGFL